MDSSKVGSGGGSKTIPQTHQAKSGEEPELAKDMLVGAKAIAKYLFDDDSKARQRQVFHLAEKSNIPIAHLGSRLCMRKSVFLAWLSHHEVALEQRNHKPRKEKKRED